MHIVQLLPELNQGGVEQIVLALNRGLTRRGHSSTVISAGGDLAAQVEADGGNHITLDLCSKNPPTFPYRVRQLRHTLYELRPDILHAHSRVPAWLTWFANRKLAIPFITTVHGFNSVGKYSAIMTRGDRVICVSHPVKRYVQQHYETPDEKISVIHCGIDPKAFNPDAVDAAEVERIKDAFDLHGKWVATSIGRITELKDYETFIEACAKAVKSRPELKGLIVGGVRQDKEDYFHRLTELIRELGMEKHIHIATDLTNMPAVYTVSDVVVSCSKKPESFGLTLVEALAMNTPVIASRHGGPLDIIQEGENGFFFPPGNVEELARLLASDISLDRDPRNDVIDRFSITHMIDSTLDVYTLCKGGPIQIDEGLFLGEGSHRAAYRHPKDPGKCLKIVKPGTLEERRKKNKKWYKRLRKVEAFDETRKDLKAYMQLEGDEKKLSHIPRFHGMVETSMGPAMLLDLVINEDGTSAKPLINHLDAQGSKERIRNSLLELGRHLIDSAIIVRDFSIGDVMVSECMDGSLKLYVVDGLGASEFIPLSRIPYFAKRTAARRVDRFFGKIIRAYPEMDLPCGGLQ